MRKRSFSAGMGALAVCWAASVSGVAMAASQVNVGTQDWASAARAGRADMLILGDSVTWVNGFGWDQGMTKAGLSSFGLAGTGLIVDSALTGEGYGYGVYGGSFFNNGYQTTIDAVPADRQGHALRLSAPITAGATPVGGLTFAVTGGSLDPTAAFDIHVYTASPAGGGTMGALRRVNGEVGGVWFPTLQHHSTVPTATPAKGLQESVFSFAAQPGLPGKSMEFRLTDMTNTSVLYSRLTRPEAKGITVSSLGYGGHGTHDFYDDILGTMSSAGRSTYLSSLVDDGSGKLNVMIAQGLNDRNDSRMSVNGVGQGKTAEGFRDNLTSLIAMLRADWAAAGFVAGNLSFTLVGMYETDSENAALKTFAGIEADLAASDPQISFVDLMSIAPDHATAVRAGYFLDGVHPTAAGAEAFSGLVMNTISAVPEPSTLGLVTAAMALAIRRRTAKRPELIRQD